MPAYLNPNGRGGAYEGCFTAAAIVVGDDHPFADLGLQGWLYIANIASGQHGSGLGSGVIRSLVELAGAHNMPGVCIRPTPVADRPMSVAAMYEWFARLGFGRGPEGLAILAT